MSRRNKKINRLLATMIMSMVVCTAFPQVNGGRPTLMVGIVIDQLRSDYIDLLREHFGEDGFNRLINSGVYFDNVDFRIPSPDIASGTAILYTGNYPNVNGITASKVRDRKLRKEMPVLHDANVMGNFTSETLSPRALKVSTICDEARLGSAGLGYVYSFAPDANQAILMAGHAANAAFWINDVNGKWSTSTFYKELPSVVQARNYKSPLSSRLDTMDWRPLIDIEKYAAVATHRTFYPFRYFYGRNDVHRYRAFKQSPLVNDEVASVAVECMKSMKLGRRGELDIINIGLTAAPYAYGTTSDYSVELQDTYLRLDRQLASIFKAIEQTAGFGNTVVFVASTGYFKDSTADDPRFNIPGGDFYPKRAISLLNMFLIAKYGNGDWINGFYDGQFFFNHEFIKSAGHDIAEIRARSAEFLRMMSGVAQAFSLEEVLNNPVTSEAKALNLAVNPENAADIYIRILPGWNIVNEEHSTAASTAQHNVVRSNAVNSPVILLIPDTKPQKITSLVDAAFLAPTVTRALRIRSPNGAFHKPLSF